MIANIKELLKQKRKNEEDGYKSELWLGPNTALPSDIPCNITDMFLGMMIKYSEEDGLIAVRRVPKPYKLQLKYS